MKFSASWSRYILSKVPENCGLMRWAIAARIYREIRSTYIGVFRVPYITGILEITEKLNKGE